MSVPKLPNPAETDVPYRSSFELKCSESMELPIALKRFASAARVQLDKFDITTENKGAIAAFFSPRRQFITFDAVGRKENVDIFSKAVNESIADYNYRHALVSGERTELVGKSGKKILNAVEAEAALRNIQIVGVTKDREKLSFFKHLDHVLFTPMGSRANLERFSAALAAPDGVIQKLLVPSKDVQAPEAEQLADVSR